MKENFTLEMVILDGNSLNGLTMRKITTMLWSSHLTKLSLENCMLGDAGALAVGEGIAKSKHVLDVNLSKNMIKDEGGEIFASVIRTYKNKLRYLNLGYNYLNESIEKYGEALTVDKNLKTLILRDNNIQSKPVMEFIEKFKKNTTLRRL